MGYLPLRQLRRDLTHPVLSAQVEDVRDKLSVFDPLGSHFEGSTAVRDGLLEKELGGLRIPGIEGHEAEEVGPHKPGGGEAPALGPGDRSLFKGRQDLVRIIDHDLTGDRRASLLLFGQRRMGKSSLINMLPQVLGTGTRVVPVNFQRLGGSEHRAAPYRWVAERVRNEWPEAPAPPRATTWGATLDWLGEVERVLAQENLRLLIAVDEVEKLEIGIQEGWATPDFLDFVRAAADTLHRVRFLLASAHRPQRLGRHWVDRLISALPREMGFLDEPAARSLVLEPIPDFPDIYPPEGVGRILERTHRHPRTLLDLVGLSQELREFLGREVDVVTERSLSPYLRDQILAEAKPL